MGACTACEVIERTSVFGEVTSAVLASCGDSGILLACCISKNLVSCRLCSIIRLPFCCSQFVFLMCLSVGWSELSINDHWPMGCIRW